MKTKLSKNLSGLINLEVSKNDPVAWKLLMLFTAAHANNKNNIEQIANEFGYTREHFYVVKGAFENNGAEGLKGKQKGPSINYKRTEEATKMILRHRFLDPEASCSVITQKMQQAGYDISQRSVERVVNEFGLQKKGYIKQIRRTRTMK